MIRAGSPAAPMEAATVAFACPSCGRADFDASAPRVAPSLALAICPACGFHARVGPRERLAWLADAGSFQEYDATMQSVNPIGMAGYPEKLADSRARTGERDAVVTGRLSIEGRLAVVIAMNFAFMGGSMGSVVGEKISRALAAAVAARLPAIAFTASGGARMQEGVFSLMQMAKTAAAVTALGEAGLPLFVVLTDPTTGGVTASFASLGTVILAEPGALVGFTAARIVEGRSRQRLPEGFQRAETQLAHGFVDAIVPRDKQRATLAFLIDAHAGGIAR